MVQPTWTSNEAMTDVVESRESALLFSGHQELGINNVI